VKIIFAGKYCKKLPLEKFKKYEYVFIDEFEDYNKHLEASDIIISYGYGKIFKDNGLKNKIFNLHPSILPYGRGIYPIPWSIYNNHPIGYTIYQINSNRIDEGLVYSTKKINYDLNDTFSGLWDKITKSAENDFVLNFENYFINQSSTEVKDKDDKYYKNKKDSKTITKFLKEGWDTKIKDFLFYTKNRSL
jgi:methionyl-tRNA formyltransferase